MVPFWDPKLGPIFLLFLNIWPHFWDQKLVTFWGPKIASIVGTKKLASVLVPKTGPIFGLRREPPGKPKVRMSFTSNTKN